MLSNLLRTLTTLSAILLAFVVALPTASAEETWAMLPISSRQIEPGHAETFRDLLQSELANQGGMRFVRVESTCQDAVCAAEAGKSAGAEAAVFGSLATLGEKVIVTATVVNVADARPRHSERMSVDRVEELDIVATRLARAITTNQPVAATVELGSVTAAEARPERRRHGLGGLGLGVGAIVPAKGYAGVPVGMAFDLAYWYEAPAFAIGPRIGLRFQADTRDDDSFLEVPIDIGAYYVLGLGDFAPFFGGGAGVRYIHDSRRVKVTTGSLIYTEHSADKIDEQWAFGAYARAGVLLFRTYSVRVSLSGDYNVTFAQVNDESIPQSFTFMMSVYF